MKLFHSFLMVLFCSSCLWAQYDNRIAETTIPLDKVEQVKMPTQDNKALIQQELRLRRPGRAEHFAIPLEVNINPDQHGTWEELNDGSKVWRIRIYSKNAKSLNLGFTKFVMPEGGSMILYASDYSIVRGPFTPADNDEHEQLWCPIIEHDEIVLEVKLENPNRNDLKLQLSYVNHDFVGFSSIVSGSCNLDVICGAEDGWEIVDGYRDIIRSVAFMTLNGSANCTGFLVNNTRQDATPYFMSADHCGMNGSNAPTLVTYWNFENTTCRQPNSPESGANGDGPLETFNSGSIFRAGLEDTDFTLVELDDPVVEEAQGYFNGWNASQDELPTSAIAVHHPSNDEKRISFENDPLHRGEWGSGGDMIADGDHLIVPDWDIGTTEGGSSGSPLFDQDKRVVGQLHGGGAACGNNAYDSYGWFALSWEGGGTPQTRLKDWLDPDDTGILILDGKDGSFALNLSSSALEICASDDVTTFEVSANDNFNGDVALSVINAPSGLITNFTNSTITPGGSTMLTISNISSLNTGQYNLEIIGNDGTDSGSTIFNLSVFAGIPTPSSLISPANSITGANTFSEYTWEDDIAASSYDIEIATNNSFTNIIESATGLKEASYTGATLNAETTYYWRVKAYNICGEADWSSVFSFTTADIQCSNNSPNDLPLEIDNGPPNTITSELEVTSSGSILDLNIKNLVGSHTWLEDLTFILISPQGTEVVLIAEQCGSEENFNISFDDQAESNPFPCPYNDGNTYQPAQSLSDFNGENATGIWILRIEDSANNDGGSLDSWELEICTSSENDFSLVSSINNATVCTDDDFTFDLSIGGGFEDPVAVSFTVNPPVTFGLGFNADPNNVSPGSNLQVIIANFLMLPLGDYTVTFMANDGNETSTTSVDLTIIDVPESAALTAPNNDGTGISRNPIFEWSSVDNSEYTIELATDMNFNNIVLTNSPSSASYNYSSGSLEPNTTYFWRVTTSNECGENVSDINSFTTEDNVAIEGITDSAIRITPNPTNGLVNIYFDQMINSELEIELFSVNGQLMKSHSYNTMQNLVSLNLTDFSTGIYIIKIKTNAGALAKRIVVQK